MSAKKAAKKTVKKVAKKAVSESDPSQARSKSSRHKLSSPDHKDVIELATRLVSAQIMASSYHDTAMGLIGEIRQMAFDVVESFHDGRSSESSDIDDPHRKIGMELFAKMRMQRRRMRPNRMLEPMSHPDLDKLFQSAMRRAHVMLNAPYDPERIVFGEQLFSSTETLTEGAIRERFMSFRWPGLKSGTSVINLMREVNSWFVKHLVTLDAQHQSVERKDSINATDSSVPIQTRIKAEAARLSWLLEKARGAENIDPDATVTYEALSTAVSDFTRKCDGIDIAGSFRSHDARELNNLVMAMFNPGGPRKPSIKMASKSHKNSSDATAPHKEGSITYRPYAIFRYLRRHGREPGDELGLDLNKRLKAKRSDLKQDMVPDIPGIAPTEFGYGPLHEEVEDLLEYYESEGAYSDSGWNADELELHGGDSGCASELDRPQGLNSDGISKF